MLILFSFFSTSLFADLLNDVVAEVNYVRTRPQEYAQKRLVPRLKKFKGTYYYITNTRKLATAEGVTPVKECIEMLKRQKPLKPFTMNRVLCIAAQMHAKDQKRTGAIGHEGSDGSGPGDRIKRAGFKGYLMGENVQYGCFDAIEIVIDLLIDDDVPDRGHRLSLLSEEYEEAGVAFEKGGNAACGSVCVITLGAGGKGGTAQNRNNSRGYDSPADYGQTSSNRRGRNSEDCGGEYDDSDDYDDYEDDD